MGEGTNPPVPAGVSGFATSPGQSTRDTGRRMSSTGKAPLMCAPLGVGSSSSKRRDLSAAPSLYDSKWGESRAYQYNWDANFDDVRVVARKSLTCIVVRPDPA